jgi:hypothetical protein
LKAFWVLWMIAAAAVWLGCGWKVAAAVATMLAVIHVLVELGRWREQRPRWTRSERQMLAGKRGLLP